MDNRHDSAAARPDGGTETRILDAAHLVFVRRGTAGARMQEIADEAGVNKALLHYYFRNKNRLAEAVFRRVGERLFPPVLDILGSDAEIEEKVERVVALELEHLSRTPFAPAYLISEMNHHPERARQLVKALTGIEIDGATPRVRATLERQLKARARAGTLRRISAEQFVVNLVALCVFPFAMRPMLALALGLDAQGFQRFIDQRKKQLPEFFLNALRP
ncbi:MAG TPA: helix-turn-helix domain-containing protein [Gemmatimonadaceae bacterium]|nr:helix-turn-helix domain-containing protein [Gemmatimonadaceae bacterium]